MVRACCPSTLTGWGQRTTSLSPALAIWWLRETLSHNKNKIKDWDVLHVKALASLRRKEGWKGKEKEKRGEERGGEKVGSVLFSFKFTECLASALPVLQSTRKTCWSSKVQVFTLVLTFKVSGWGVSWACCWRARTTQGTGTGVCFSTHLQQKIEEVKSDNVRGKTNNNKNPGSVA